MKLKYLILPFLVFAACRHKEKEKQKIKNYVKITEETKADYPYRTEEDSGYFKGYESIEIDTSAKGEENHLTRFLSSVISDKEVILLSNKIPSHSVFINPQKKIRFDTLRNNEVLLVSEHFFGEKEKQKITINGEIIRNYSWNGVDSLREDIYGINHDSFRYFSYKGSPYYYFNANIMGMSGGSAGNIYYHFVFNVKTKQLSSVYSCRFGKMLVGDADGDNYLDFLHFDNSDFCTTVPSSDNVTIWLYSFDEKGKPILRKDLNGREYFIKGNTGAGYSQDSFIVKQYLWPVKLNK